MRTIILAAALLVPTLAAAQQPPPVQPNPEATALGQMVMDAAQREAGLRVQLNAALAKAASLEAAAKPPPAPGTVELSPPGVTPK